MPSYVLEDQTGTGDAALEAASKPLSNAASVGACFRFRSPASPHAAHALLQGVLSRVLHDDRQTTPTHGQGVGQRPERNALCWKISAIRVQLDGNIEKTVFLAKPERQLECSITGGGMNPHARRSCPPVINDRVNKPVSWKCFATRRYLGNLSVRESIRTDKPIFHITHE
jgi:hypothetical protein